VQFPRMDKSDHRGHCVRMRNRRLNIAGVSSLVSITGLSPYFQIRGTWRFTMLWHKLGRKRCIWSKLIKISYLNAFRISQLLPNVAPPQATQARGEDYRQIRQKATDPAYWGKLSH
jgi:hypothetical protein